MFEPVDCIIPKRFAASVGKGDTSGKGDTGKGDRFIFAEIENKSVPFLVATGLMRGFSLLPTKSNPCGQMFGVGRGTAAERCALVAADRLQ